MPTSRQSPKIIKNKTVIKIAETIVCPLSQKLTINETEQFQSPAPKLVLPKKSTNKTTADAALQR